MCGDFGGEGGEETMSTGWRHDVSCHMSMRCDVM